MAKLVSFFLRPFIVAADMVEKAVLRGLAPAHRPQDCGFVFATTGALYTVLARRAARTLRKTMPDAQIDLFTDQVLDDPVFTQIHRLHTSSSRPKMEAMRRSRFGKTVYLDADIVVLADVSELFALLDRVEFAACQGVARNNDFMGDGIIPRANRAEYHLNQAGSTRLLSLRTMRHRRRVLFGLLPPPSARGRLCGRQIHDEFTRCGKGDSPSA